MTPRFLVPQIHRHILPKRSITTHPCKGPCQRFSAVPSVFIAITSSLLTNVAAYLLFVVSGVVRSCKICKSGTRSVVAFYLPGDLFGWIDPQLSLSIEAATDTEVLFIKRSGLLSLASRDARVANVLLRATTNELARAQEHVLLMSKSAKCRAATFLTDLWVRLGKPQYLDVPMSHQDIADYLGLTTETFSRSITDMERSGLIARVASQRRLLLQNHFGLRRVMN
jgi:CRP/FNR family transcriptional regulator, nitrogen fixation regulation protein